MGVDKAGVVPTVQKTNTKFAIFPAFIPVCLDDGDIKITGVFIEHVHSEVITESCGFVEPLWRLCKIGIWSEVNVLSQDKVGLVIDFLSDSR